MSYWFEEDELDCVILEQGDSNVTGSKMRRERSASMKEPFYCCICGMDISFLPYSWPLLYNHLTQQNEQQRNDHVNLCLSRSEHGKSAKRNIHDFFSKKESTPPISSTASLASIKNASPAVSVKLNSLMKRGVQKVPKPKRMARKQKTTTEENEPIDVPNSILVPF